MSIRRRLTQEESRTAAMEAARALLIEAGPQAVTLKAVASRIGRTHANLLHHFGSASGLQKSLAQHLAGTICKTIAEAVLAQRAGIGSAREVVDLTFDAFDREGGGGEGHRNDIRRCAGRGRLRAGIRVPDGKRY